MAFLNESIKYKGNKGEISLIHPCYATQHLFEIYSIDGDLCEDIERYNTIEEAEQRISELIN